MDNSVKSTIFAAPTPGEIEALREAVGDTMERAAARVHTGKTHWSKWESGVHAMPLAAWELYTIKVSRILQRRKRSSSLRASR